MAFSHTFDTATPPGSGDPAEADDRMREIKAAVQERGNVDHYWPLTGTEVSDADAAEHRKITLRTLSAVAVAALTAAKAYIYHLVTDGEFYLKDASDNTIQLSSGGKIPSASLDMKDEDNMVSDSATHAATQQSIKAFAEAEAATAAAAVDSADDFTPTSYAGEESITFPNGLILKQGTATPASAADATVTFAAAFPTAITNAWCTWREVVSNDVENCGVHTLLVGSMKVRNPNTGWAGKTVNWFAIGY